MKPVFFPDAAAFRAWLEQHHATATELHLGFHKKSSGRIGLTYLEAVLEALCFGWIDGVVRRIDDHRYQHRFTPRQKSSTWSNVNIARAEQLRAQGRMAPAGLAAFEARSAEKSGIYSFEQKAEARLPHDLTLRFRADAAAWSFFSAQTRSYRHAVVFHVMAAKQPTTRLRRLARLIAASAAGRRLD